MSRRGDSSATSTAVTMGFTAVALMVLLVLAVVTGSPFGWVLLVVALLSLVGRMAWSVRQGPRTEDPRK